MTIWFASDEPHGWTKKREYREELMLPYMNMEALVKDKWKFLSLVHHRSTYEFSDFAMMDLHMMDMGCSTGLLERDFNSSCVIMYGHMYGRLTPFDAALLHRGDYMGYPIARLVLEAQCSLMRVIRQIVEEALTTVVEGSGQEKWSEQAVLGFQSREPDIGAGIAALPFGPPLRFDPDIWQETLTLQMEACEDELAMLQTSPSYLQELIRQKRNNTYIKTMPEDTRWALLSVHSWINDYENATMWRMCDNVVRCLGIIFDKYKHQPGIGPGNLVFDDVNFFGLELHDILHAARKKERAYMLGKVARSQAFEERFTIGRPTENEHWGSITPKLEFRTHEVQKQLFATDRLYWCLVSLSCNDDEMPSWLARDRSLLISLLADTLKYDTKKQQGRMDDVIVDSLETFSVLFELELAIKLHRPLMTPALETLAGEEAAKHGVIKLNYGILPCDRPIVGIDGDLDGRQSMDEGLWSLWSSTAVAPSKLPEDRRPTFSSRLGPPAKILKNFCNYTWPKGKRDIKWLASAQTSRKLLRELWDYWRTEHREYYEALLPGTNISKLYEYRLLNFDKTQQYLRECDEEEAWIEEAWVNATDLEERKRKAQPSISGYVTPASEVREDRFVAPEPSKRAKKRLKARSMEPPTPAPEPEPASPKKPPIFVSKASLSIFAQMWPSQSGVFKDGSVRWPSVLAAMGDAGFGCNNGDGSVVVFKLQNGSESQRRICFHRVHRDGDRVDVQILRRIGHRLADRFDWSWDRFQDKDRMDS